MSAPLKILLAIDGSAPSLHAVEHVLHLLRGGLQARIVIANAQPGLQPLDVPATRADKAVVASHAAGDHSLLPARARLDAFGVAYEAEVVLADGEPAHALLEIAARHGAGLIVVGARRVGLLRQTLLGSVSRTLVQDSPIPVTVVRESGHEAASGRHAQSRSRDDAGGSGGGGRADTDGDGSPGGGDGGDGGGGDGGGGD